MFKSIWKGVKWFFSPNEQYDTKIDRKHNFAHRKADLSVDPFIRVSGKPTNTSEEVQATYAKMVKIKKQETHSYIDDDTIELAKREVWIPHGISTAHKELILANCGFQRNVPTRGVMEYDPRLVQVINYAMNMYAAQVATEVQAIIGSTEPTK